MHIVHVISSPDARHGGTQAVVAGLAAAQSAAGAQVSVISCWRSGEQLDLAEELSKSNVHVELVGPCQGPLRTHARLKPVLQHFIGDGDVVHIHALWEEIQHAAARTAAARGVPYIFAPHGMLDPWCLAQSKLKKRLYLAWRLRRDFHDAAAIHYTSEPERTLTISITGSRPAIVEPNGIDLDAFRLPADPSPLLRAFPSIAGRRVILFLGRVHYKKGFDILLPAMARFRGQPVVLVIAGPGEPSYLNGLQRQVREFGLEPQVVFTGALRGELRSAAYAAAELFVLPSYDENFGIAVIEALALECPVIISDQVQVHTEITAGQVGAVLPLDAGRWADEIARWLADDLLRASARARARTFVSERFDWQRLGARWLDHYQTLIGSAAPRAPPS